jgi:hypothetical protein
MISAIEDKLVGLGRSLALPLAPLYRDFSRRERLLVRSTVSPTPNSHERARFLAYLPMSVASLMM